MSARPQGFTLLEVMVALAILAVALVAIADINGQAIRTHSYAKKLSIATMLARSKMVDLESKFIEEGFTSEFDQKMEGDFSDDGWEEFRWEAEIIKPELDAANATGMVEGLVSQLGGLGDPGDKPKMSMTASSMSKVGAQAGMAQQAALALAPMIEGQVATLTTTIEKAVREVRLKVTWEDGAQQEELTVVTHFVVLAPAGQPGGDSNDPEATYATLGAKAALGAAGGQPNPGSGSSRRDLPPGSAPDTFIAPSGQLTGPGIERPQWVPDWIPRPPPGARYNPAVQGNPRAPPFIWEVPMK